MDLMFFNNSLCGLKIYKRNMQVMPDGNAVKSVTVKDFVYYREGKTLMNAFTKLI